MKKLLTLVALVGLVSGLHASGQGESSGEKKVVPLRVGIMPASVGVPVQYAQDKGYFSEVGLKVEISMFQTGAPINEAIAAKQIDAAASGAASIFSFASGTCTMLAEISSSGGMGIYVRPDSDILKSKGLIKGLPNMYGSRESLLGKKFLGQLGTSAQLNVSKYTSRFGVGTQDYTLVHMDAGPALQAFIAGQGDALAAYPPYSFNAEAAGMVKICSFEEATGFSIADPIFVRTEVANARKDDIVKFVQCVVRANEELKNDRLRAEYSLKFFKDNGREYTEKTMADEIAVRKYLGKAEYQSSSYSFGKSFIDQGDFYVTNGKITTAQIPFLKKAMDPYYLNTALGIKVRQE